MKKLKQLSLILIIGAVVITINACKKGQDGAPGKDGSSNVTSHTYSISSWSNTTSYYYTDLNFPELTASNINTASVQVYFGTVANTWTALPFTEYATFNYWMKYITTVNNVEIQWWHNTTTLGSDPVAYYSGATSLFKVVVIPPAMIAAHPDLDLKNYNMVKTTFNLKD
ncbi:MAG: hypothetical protein ACXVDZ_17005 [Bacteroidia bacterium]